MLSAQEVESLYRSHSVHLRRVVQGGARAPEQVIEDACQHAWTSVLAHRARVDGRGAFRWLARTAVHEAWRLAERDEVELGEGEAQSGVARRRSGAPQDPLEVIELRERLRALRQLPARQQRVLWLHAAGLNYAEIAHHEGASVRTVERQLLRGRRAARGLDR